MNPTLTQIEKTIEALPVDKQLLLISKVAERLRRGISVENNRAEHLSLMADDADIQRELREIAIEFEVTNADGLEDF